MHIDIQTGKSACIHTHTHTHTRKNNWHGGFIQVQNLFKELIQTA